jgi:hypothetical protein
MKSGGGFIMEEDDFPGGFFRLGMTIPMGKEDHLQAWQAARSKR